MKRQFVNRVQVERRVLGLVNRSFPENMLHGLSGLAISAWSAGFDEKPPLKLIDLVHSISNRLRLAVDASRDIFSDDELSPVVKIDDYIATLKEVLSEY